MEEDGVVRVNLEAWRNIISAIRRYGGIVHIRNEAGVYHLENVITWNHRNAEIGAGDCPLYVSHPPARRSVAELMGDRFRRRNYSIFSFLVTMFIVCFLLTAVKRVLHDNGPGGRVKDVLLLEIQTVDEAVRQFVDAKLDETSSKKVIQALEKLYFRHMDDLDMFCYLVKKHSNAISDGNWILKIIKNREFDVDHIIFR